MSIIYGGTVLNRDFKEFIRLLNANNVKYMVVGGYAEDSRSNAEKLIKSLSEFGFGELGLIIEDFLVPDQIIQLGHPPSRIDLLNTLSGITFSDCYDARVQIQIEGISVNFIDLENLKKNKLASGRYQDLADLENLEE